MTQTLLAVLGNQRRITAFMAKLTGETVSIMVINGGATQALVLAHEQWHPMMRNASVPVSRIRI
eukprot:364639-Chlamydomonas_euryale.AAC.12